MSGGGGGNQTSTSTTTIEDVETTSTQSQTAEEDPEEVDFPTGLSSDSVEAYLADSHTNELARESFEVTWLEANVTEGKVDQQRTYKVGDGIAIGEWTGQGPITMYMSGEGGYWREDLGDTVTYGQHRSGYSIQWLTQNDMLRELIQAGDWENPKVENAGESPEFLISASGLTNPTALKEEFDAESFESFTSEGVVTDQGVVEKLQSEFEFYHEERDRLFQYRHRFSVNSVGDISVSTPDWVATAKSRAPDISASITDDQQYVEMEFKSGNPILADTDLVLYDNDNRTNAGYRDLGEPLESGNTYFLYLEDGEMGISRGSRPTSVSPDSLTNRYALWAHRHGAEYFMISGL